MFFSTRSERLDKLLVDDLGCKKIPHVKGGSLYDHLCRVSEFLARHGCDEVTVLASRAHSLYSTEFFSQGLLSTQKRDLLQAIIGKEAEDLVFHFCGLDRSTIESTNNHLSYRNRFTGEQASLDTKNSKRLAEIITANALDHITVENIGYLESEFATTKKRLEQFLKPALLEELSACFVDSRTNHKSERIKLTYISHACVHFVSASGRAVVIDPWLYPSSFQQPILRGLKPGSQTIDYIIPEPRSTISDLKANYILLSHFHVHHSPLREIKELASYKPVTIICPPLSQAELVAISERIGSEVYEKITFQFVSPEKEVVIEETDLSIKIIPHTQRDHLSFLVSDLESSYSFLHIADAVYNNDVTRNIPEEKWNKFFGLRPDHLFISAAPMSLRVVQKDLKREIYENATLTPIQAAKIVSQIKPLSVSLIGMDNFSIWCNRIEYRLDNDETYKQFYWAMSFLRPAVVVKRPYPGQVVSN
jgi:hypothetical protein